MTQMYVSMFAMNENSCCPDKHYFSPIFLACTLSDHYVTEQQYHKSNNMVSNLLIATAILVWSSTQSDHSSLFA